MKSKSFLLMMFLLMLYIGPSIFALPYASSTIPTEPNMTKDFSLSAEDWLTGWSYRKSVSIDGSNGAETDYQVKITVSYDSNMQNDFDDIRFTDNDGTTPLDHWRETYTASTTALFWVEVADDLDSNQLIYMYYGNDEASSASNGAATFLFYEDWSSQSLDAWTVADGQTDGQTTFSPTGATQGGYVGKVEGDPADSYLIYTDYTHTAPFATRFRSNIEEAGTGNLGRMGTGWAGAYGWAFVETSATSDERFSVYDDDGNDDHQTMTNADFDTYTVWEILRCDIAFFGKARLYANDAQIEMASFDPDIISNPICSIQVTDSEDDIYSDWVLCRKLIYVEPEFNSFGEEETILDWNIVGTVTLIFWVAVDTAGLDMLLIILGLILIPVSTLFLVKGGRSEMSTDKLFFFLILFLCGWGLFLGGIFG